MNWTREQKKTLQRVCSPQRLSLSTLSPQALTSTRRPRLTSRPNLKTWTRRRTPRKSTPTSHALLTPRTCSSCSTLSLTSSSRTTWRTVASSKKQIWERVKVSSERETWQVNDWSPSEIMTDRCVCFCFSDYLKSSNDHEERGSKHTSWMTALANHDFCFDLLFIKTPKRLKTRRDSQNFNKCWSSRSYC